MSTIQAIAMILVRRFLHAYVEGGPRGLCSAIYRKVAGRLAGSDKSVVKGDSPTIDGANAGPGQKGASSVHPFDLEYGTDTGGLIPGEQLVSGRRNDLWNTAYYGISPSGFNQTMEALDLDWPRFTFTDLGSGKGRALLLASRFPFRRIVGVEWRRQILSGLLRRGRRAVRSKRIRGTLRSLFILWDRWSCFSISRF